MDTTMFVMLAEASFGVGIAVGISSGLIVGLLFGAAAGAAYASKKVSTQLTNAMDAGEISLVGKDGQPIPKDSISEWVGIQPSKVSARQNGS